MADVHSVATRSYNMSQIKNKNTKPEILVRKFLFAKGFRYRLYEKKLPGKPDIVLTKYKTVIFVNGCFWHGHEDCKYFKLPKTRTEWWSDKIKKNIQNDLNSHSVLKKQGYNVLVIWECELKNKNAESTLNRILDLINDIAANKI